MNGLQHQRLELRKAIGAANTLWMRVKRAEVADAILDRKDISGWQKPLLMHSRQPDRLSSYVYNSLYLHI